MDWADGIQREFQQLFLTLVLQSIQEETDSIWICRMHPDASLASCSANQENMSKASFSASDGFVTVGDSLGEESNVSFFRQLLASYPELLTEKHGAIWWLAKQNPELLRENFQVIFSKQIP